jgi:DNA processing protein
MLSQKEIESTLVLNSLQDIGPVRFQALLKHFGSAAAALDVSPLQWAGLADLDDNLVKKISAEMADAHRDAEDDLKLIQREEITLLFWQDENYPSLLKETYYAPLILYVKGEDICISRPTVAMVGSRRCSYYGEKMAKLLARGLAEAGVTTVSGLARGIDSHVHCETLAAKGKTWAVVGSGLSVMYPPENRELARLIENGGAIISEFPMKTSPFPGNFPRRNRIISGLSLATVLVEGGEKSGSLITARLAAEQGRDVMAVPGLATSTLSVAPHRFIQLGAKLVHRVEDILEELPDNFQSMLRTPAHRRKEDMSNLLPEQKEILSIIDETPFPKELLAVKIKKSPAELSTLLFDMEIKGLVISLVGGCVARK